MASTTSPEASEIRRRGRRRLLGAVTLVLLAVVFIPMILDNEPRPQRAEPSLTIPRKDNAAPLPAPAPSPIAKPEPAPAKAEPPPAAAKTEPPPAAVKAEPPPAAAEVEPVAPPSSRAPQSGKTPASNAPAKAAGQPKLEGFAVQVGAFRDEARLQQAREKLEAAGIVHYTERIDASGGAMTRLRAGPFPTREAAEKARAKLQEGQVVPLP